MSESSYNDDSTCSSETETLSETSNQDSNCIETFVEDWDDERDLGIICYTCVAVLTENDNGRAACLDCQMKNAKHPQVLTKFGFPVDEKLVDLIETFTGLGIHTSNSCQDKNGIAWISFADHAHLRLFALVKKYDKVCSCLTPDHFKSIGDEESADYNWTFPNDQIEKITQVWREIKSEISPSFFSRIWSGFVDYVYNRYSMY